MKFINTEPRKTRHIPEWSKNLEHEESRLWLMNNHEMAHVRELIEEFLDLKKKGRVRG